MTHLMRDINLLLGR